MHTHCKKAHLHFEGQVSLFILSTFSVSKQQKNPQKLFKLNVQIVLQEVISHTPCKFNPKEISKAVWNSTNVRT
jgi:hypothetical protein